MQAHPDPAVSVIVLTLNEGEHLRRTIESIEATMTGSFEIVVIDDGSEDGSADFLNGGNSRVRLLRTDNLGVANGRNFGARCARGQLLVFSDAHIETPPGWWEPMAEVLKDLSVGAVGPGLTDTVERTRRGYGMRFTGPGLTAEWLYPESLDVFSVPLLPGGFWAIRRETFERVGGLDNGMVRWGSEDFELSLRLCLLGYDLRVVPEVEVAHLFRSSGPYSVDHECVIHNQLRMAYVHFNDERFERVRSTLRESPAFEPAWALLQRNGARERRDDLRARRVRDDEWYFQSFGAL
jgi:GT2 family glycosyltransferase